MVAVLLRQFGIAGHDAAHRLRQIKADRFAPGRAAARLAQLQHGIDQRTEALGFVDDDLHVLRGVFARQIAHHFGVALNQRQRGAQVVADIGDQFLLHLFHAPQITRGLRQLGVELGDFTIAHVLHRGIFAPAEGTRRLSGFHQRPGDAP